MNIYQNSLRNILVNNVLSLYKDCYTYSQIAKMVNEPLRKIKHILSKNLTQENKNIYTKICGVCNIEFKTIYHYQLYHKKCGYIKASQRDGVWKINNRARYNATNLKSYHKLKNTPKFREKQEKVNKVKRIANKINNHWMTIYGKKRLEKEDYIINKQDYMIQ